MSSYREPFDFKISPERDRAAGPAGGHPPTRVSAIVRTRRPISSGRQALSYAPFAKWPPVAAALVDPAKLASPLDDLLGVSAALVSPPLEPDTN